MNHLTTDEIVKFISVNKLNDDTKYLVSRVNEHIRTCDKCLELVTAFQMVEDGFNEELSICSHNAECETETSCN